MIMRAGCFSILLSVAVLSACGRAESKARHIDAGDALRGINAVIVEVMASDGTAKFLDIGAIRTALELDLRQSGVEVRPFGDDLPRVELLINTLPVGRDTIFTLELRLRQWATLRTLDGVPQAALATTWNSSQIGTTDRASYILEVLEPLQRQFMNDYLSVNPKR